MTSWPQWGTPEGSQAGAILKVVNGYEQALADAENWPTPVVWFNTQNEAIAYAKRHSPAGYQAWTAVNNSPGIKQIKGGAQSVLNTGTNTLTGISSFAAVFKGLAENITDPKMWRSLGWLVLGAILLILGIMLWLKHSGYLPDMVPVPV